MNKSLLVILVFSLLTACVAVPKYQISDYDMQQWILKQNAIEQCLYPEEYQKGIADPSAFAHISRNEKALLLELGRIVLVETIGQKNIQTMKNDYSSRVFFENQFRKFNHANPTNLDEKWCNNLRKNYRATLENIEKQQLAARKQAEKERKAREAFYATTQGQAFLAQQQLQRQQMAHQAYLQRQQMQHEYNLQRQRQFQQQMRDTGTNKTLDAFSDLLNTARDIAYHPTRYGNSAMQLEREQQLYEIQRMQYGK